MLKRGTERRRLGGRVGVRLPPGTAAAVAIAADAAGLSAGAWIRACLVDRLGTEAPDAVPVAARRPPRPPASRHVIEVARLREAAAELGGAQTKAAVRTRTDGPLSTASWSWITPPLSTRGCYRRPRLRPRLTHG